MTNGQWVQSMFGCILEESNVDIRNQISVNFCRLMQDAIVLSFDTASRAHAGVLHEAERSAISWVDNEGVEKCRNTYTQHFL